MKGTRTKELSNGRKKINERIIIFNYVYKIIIVLNSVTIYQVTYLAPIQKM